MSKPDISILLPSRGRTQMLLDSIRSLVDLADDASQLQFLLGFDTDNVESSEYFVSTIAPILDEAGSQYIVLGFKPMGYHNLHQYLNKMGPYATAPWWVFWNDDAVMLDQGWDTVILSHKDQFCIQAFDTHTKHPYSIFPIVPRAWFEQLGYLSTHQLNDAYISQIAWMLDIMVRIPVRVEHNRFDLTGNNNDSTFQNRTIFEGNPNDPRDFNYITQRDNRVQDAYKLCKYLEDQGYDMSYWKNIVAGKQDPWEKMLASDVNNHMRRLSNAQMQFKSN